MKGVFALLLASILMLIIVGYSEPTQTETPTETETHLLTVNPTPFHTAKPNVVIDHTNWDWYDSQSQDIFNNLAKLKIFFAHASVGDNIMEGFYDLHTANPLEYPLAQESSLSIPPMMTENGTIYEYPRGNPPWFEKVNSFESYVKNGWHDPKVNIVMNKFCYIDQVAEWETYCNSMAALEVEYPETKFVYWTMPITTSTDTDEVLRSQFNNNLRTWIATQSNKILFDIADIEAWSPSW
jgi:hypothetical protein